MASLWQGRNGYWYIKYRNQAEKLITKSTRLKTKKVVQAKLPELLVNFKESKEE
jgi:hypothetical protein